MDREGMVHALEEIRRLLKPGGILIDIHPIPEGYLIKALQGDRILFAERKRETCSEDVLHAEDALAESVERDLFAVDRRAEFDLLTYASSVRELRDYWEELNAFEDDPKDEAIIAREEDLYAQVEEIMRASGAGAEVAIHERARIARLRPVRC
jgi:SAM-dependent methyltransferase